MRRLGYTLFEHDGDPNGIIDAPINSECRDLSAPQIWYKTTGEGILTGWVAESTSAAGGPIIDFDPLNNPTESIDIDVSDSNRVMLIDCSLTDVTLNFLDINQPTIVDIYINSTANPVVFNAGTGASVNDLAGTNLDGYRVAEPNQLCRAIGASNGVWYITSNFEANV